MNRQDINYWLSPKFDHTPPTDEELTQGRLISKPQHARIIADQIRSMVASNFPLANIVAKLDHLVSMVKDEPEDGEEE